MAKIETGVDRLVQLVKERGKLSVDDAVKELGVSKAVVQEWAEFLEEEGLLGVEYSLSKTYLVPKKLSKKEVAGKAKAYEQKKEAFVRKVDTTLKKLEKDTAGFEEIKKAYDSLKSDIGDEIDQVKHELDELKHYENLKQSIDQDIIQQKVDYQKMVDDVHRKLYAEEKRYEKLLREISNEESKLEKEKEGFQSLEEKEGSLHERLKALQAVVNSIDEQLGANGKSISSEEERLTRLRDLANAIGKEIKEKKEKELKPLVDASKAHAEKILKIQDSIISKVKERKGKISAYEEETKGIVSKFDDFFKKRMATEKLLRDLEREKAEMQHELEGLKRKAVVFNLLSKESDVKKHMAELQKGFDAYEKRKRLFTRELEKLRELIG